MYSVVVNDSPIKGKGVFAADHIPAYQVILHIDDTTIIDPHDPVLGALIGSEPDCDYLPDGTVILMKSPERYINHGCDPNVYVYTLAADRFVLAMRDIATGEELLLDYAIDLVNGDWLDCRCASAHCRGQHRSDYFMLPASKQLEYLPYLSYPFIQAHCERILRLLQEDSPKTIDGRREPR